MASFIYQARDASGRSTNGNIEAIDVQAAASSLMDRGLMVISIRAGGGDASRDGSVVRAR